MDLSPHCDLDIEDRNPTLSVTPRVMVTHHHTKFACIQLVGRYIPVKDVTHGQTENLVPAYPPILTSLPGYKMAPVGFGRTLSVSSCSKL